jgi:hypothetical protein
MYQTDERRISFRRITGLRGYRGARLRRRETTEIDYAFPHGVWSELNP